MTCRYALSSLVAVAVVFLLGSVAAAAEVQVEKLNLCCGDSGERLTASLEKAPGVSEIAIDARTGLVTFQLAEPQQQLAGALEAIQAAGLFGEVNVAGQPASFPIDRVPSGTTAAKVRFIGVHLGCRAASDAVARSLRPFEAIQAITCDPRTGQVLIEAAEGEALNVAALQSALTAAGFHARLATDGEDADE